MKSWLRASHVIWLVVGLFCLCVAGVSFLLARQFQNDAQSSAYRQAEAQARGAESALNRSLIAFDLTLAGLEVMPGLFTDAKQRLDLALAPKILRALVDQRLMLQDLAVLDGSGKVLAAAAESTMRLGLPLPDGFLAGLRSQTAPHLAFSVPATSLSSQEKVVFLARTIGPPGPGQHVAVATVLVSALTTIMAPAVEIPGLSMALENAEGELLASVPANDSLLGRRHAKPPGTRNAPSTPQLTEGRLNSAPVLASVRPTVYGSVLVTAAISASAVEARWMRPAMTTAAIAGLFALLAVLIGAMSRLYLSRLKAVTTEATHAKFVLEEALASMDEGFLLWGRDDRVLAWNERYLQMFPHLRGTIDVGVDIADVAAVAARALFPDLDEDHRQTWVAERIARGRRVGSPGFEQHLPGGKIISIVEHRTATGGLVAIYRDVTDARAAASGLEHAMRAAEAANEAKTRFLATMSHEIRTPLNGVLGMNSLLLNTRLDGKQRLYAETIQSSGKSLLTIINDILDMSRLEAGHVSIELAPFKPERLIDEVMALLGSRADAKGISLRAEHDAKLRTPLLGDASRLRQVLFNLVGNAIKFTERGGVVIESRFAELGADRIEWTVCVRDSGIGIDADVIPSLFDRFTQADSSTSRRFGGSGLGLAISRELIELMKGRISVESRIDEGSEVRVSIPLDRVPESARPADDSPCQAGPQGRGLRILVAEDNPVNQMLIVAMLQQMGHVVDVAADGLEALQRMQQKSYDLVLMDIQMPRMDGVSATRAIRQLPGAAGQVPIVAVSANVLAEQRSTYLAAGMNDHVAKPIDMALLARAIAAAVGRG